MQGASFTGMLHFSTDRKPSCTVFFVLVLFQARGIRAGLWKQLQQRRSEGVKTEHSGNPEERPPYDNPYLFNDHPMMTHPSLMTTPMTNPS